MPGRPPGNVEYSLCSAYLPRPQILTPAQDTYVSRRVETPHRGIFSYPFRGMGPARINLLQLDNSTAETNCDGLSAIACPELIHDVFDMNLYSLAGSMRERSASPRNWRRSSQSI